MATEANKKPSILQRINLQIRQSVSDNELGIIKDTHWIKQSFVVPMLGSGDTARPSLEDIDRTNRAYSTAVFKYTDSSVGGNFCINPPPQFTPYADPRVKGLSKQSVEMSVPYSSGFKGQGSYYSRAIDDNNHNIHLSFGFVAHNSLIQFFTGFYNPSAATLARTGRYSETLLGGFIKTAFDTLKIAIFPLTVLPILFMTVGDAVRWALRMPANKFSYFKNGMPVYWNIVTQLVNHYAVNRKIVTYTQSSVYESFIGEAPKLDNAKKTILHAMYPGIEENGIIDVRAIACRAKVLEKRYRTFVYDQLLQSGDAGWYGKVKQVIDEGAGLEKADPNETKNFSQKSLLEKFISVTGLGKLGSSNKKDENAGMEMDLKVDPDAKAPSNSSEQNLADVKTEPYQYKPDKGFMELVNAMASDGSDWISFRVDGKGSVSESFSNGTAPSQMAESMNSTSRAARELHVSWNDGNIDSAGIAKSVVESIGNVISGAADILHLGGLVSFSGRSFVDIPEHVTDSSSSINDSTTYKIKLISPYGNAVAQLLNIYVPLFSLIAGAAPLSTGAASYTVPLVCQLYDPGRAVTKLGVITSLTITRGTSNYAWNAAGQAMAIDVSFTVKDLSTVIAIPIHEGVSPLANGSLFPVESKYHDYSMALAAVSLSELHDRIAVAKMAADRKIADIDTFFSKSRWSQALADTMPAQLLGVLLSGPIDRR